jgi:hypothetical protein
VVGQHAGWHAGPDHGLIPAAILRVAKVEEIEKHGYNVGIARRYCCDKSVVVIYILHKRISWLACRKKAGFRGFPNLSIIVTAIVSAPTMEGC